MTLIREDPVLARFSSGWAMAGEFMATMKLTHETIEFSRPLEAGENGRMDDWQFHLEPKRLASWLRLLARLPHLIAKERTLESQGLKALLATSVKIDLRNIRELKAWRPHLSAAPQIVVSERVTVAFELLRSQLLFDQEPVRGFLSSKVDPRIAEHYEAVERAWKMRNSQPDDRLYVQKCI